MIIRTEEQATVDDLRRELKRRGAERSRARARALHRLAWAMRNVDASAAHDLAEEALTLARSLRDVEAEAFALVARAYAAVRRSQGSAAIEDAQAGVRMFRDAGNTLGLARALNTLGIGYGDSSRFMDALETFLDLLQICEETGDRIGEADALNNVGIVYVNLDDHAAALEYHMRSLRLAREIGYASGEVRTLTNLGSVAYELGRYDEALSHLEESLAKREEGRDPHTYGITLVNVGRCYQKLGRHDEALEVLDRARQLLSSIDHSLGVAYALDSTAAVQLDRADPATALEMLQTSLGIKVQSDDRKGQAATLLDIAQGHRQLGDDDAATAALTSGLAHAAEIGARTEVYRAHLQLSEIAEERGDLKTALRHFKTYNRVKDKLFNEDSDIKLRALRVGFEVEQAHKEGEIYRLKNVELAHANHELEVLARSLREADAQKSRLLRKVERQAREDALTGLSNRRHFDREIGEAFPHYRRQRLPFNVALCDIDNFKGVNDTYGHAVGDRVLKVVGRLMKSSIRKQDLVARYGGEEFIVMFPDAPAATARGICERMRLAVEGFEWASIAPGLAVTLSFGVASNPTVEHHERLISIADELLYEAKAAGKNRVFDDAGLADLGDLTGTEPEKIPDTRTAHVGGSAPAPVAMPALPAGLTLRKRGQPLETVTTQVGSIALLATRPNLEVSEGMLDEGGRMTLVPPEPRRDASPEMYYILEGRLVCELPDERFELRVGDHLIIEDLDQPVMLKAASHVRFLYTSPEPSFHHMSLELDQLRKLAVGVEFVDGYTAEHCGRMQTIAYAIGEALGLPKHRLHILDYAAYLHDVGKVKVPREILTSPNPLNDAEREIIRQHPTYGANMLADTFMAEAGPIIAQHHERLDGSGYPLGLAGDEIMLESHIVAVADTFDAMTSDRPYRKALPKETALAELRRLSGHSFPAEAVEAFERALPNLAL
ncbi:MAG: diguanylate cyclase [Trueperaceae bacterium]|nr:diguanylate cyclase [Trueperaceae bacterium]